MNKPKLIALGALIFVLIFIPGCLAQCYTIEICSNGADDDCDGSTDEGGCIAVDSRITNQPVHMGANEYWAAGELVDRIDMGYIHWSEASGDTYDPDGDENDWDNSFGEHNGQHCGSVSKYSFFYSGCSIEWDYDVPEPGYYVLSFFSWDNNDRQITPSYDNGQEVVSLPNSDKWVDMYFIYFHSAGSKRIYAYGNRGNYLRHSQLFKVRGYPFDFSQALDHPRLHFTEQDIQELDTRTSQAPILEYRNRVISGANSLIGRDPSYWTNCQSRSYNGHLWNLALAYTLTNDPRYIQPAIDGLKGIANEATWMCGPSWSYLEAGELAQATAFAYDVFYDQLSQADREEIALGIDKHLNYIYISSLNSEHRGDNSHWWSDPTTNNWGAVVNNGLGLGALAMLGENRYAEQMISQVNKVSKWLMDGYFDDDGVYLETDSYLEYARAFLIPYLDALQRIEGVNLFSYNNDILRKTSEVKLHTMHSHRFDHDTYDHGVGHQGSVGKPCLLAILRLAAEFNDGILQWHWYNVNGPDRLGRNVQNWMNRDAQCVLFYRDVPMQSPDGVIEPSRVYPIRGRVFMRSNFEDPDGIHFSMQSGLLGSHAQADQGSFIITAYKDVLVDDENRGDDESTGQNVMLIEGVGQVLGGQSHGIVSQIDSFVHSNKLDFSTANTKEAYDLRDNVVNYALRHVMFVRPSEETNDNGYFIMVDDIEKDGSTHNYQWQVHSLSGNSFTDLGDDNARIVGSQASLEILFAEPQSTSMSISSKLMVENSIPQRKGLFVTMMYPTSSRLGIALPEVEKISNAEVGGFRIGNNDLVLFNKNSGQTISQSHQGKVVTTDALLSFVRDGGTLDYFSMIDGKALIYGTLGVSSTVKTNIVLEKNDNNYVIIIGNEAADSGSATLAISGILDGTYRYYLDGVNQGNIVASGGSLEFALILGKHEIDLEYLGGTVECTDNSDCDDGSDCTADICDAGSCRYINYNLDGSDTIGLGDIIVIISKWGLNEGGPGWDPLVDLDENGNIGLSDIILLLNVWAAYC